MEILIADDDRTSRLMLASVLRKQSFEVIETEDGSSALEYLQHPDGPKLAILDWMMPDLSGLDVVREVRKHDTDEPCYIIMLTSRSETADVITGLDAGANDYLCKPFDAGELQARVQVGMRMLSLQSALLESKRTLQYQASHDTLTGLWNRGAVLASLQNEMHRFDREAHGELFIGLCDIDLFKLVNDRHGHPAGDAVLRSVANALLQSVRDYDFVGRVGGEEFLIIARLEDQSIDAGLFFDRIRMAIETLKIDSGDETLSVTISIGIAKYNGTNTVSGLYAEADSALYSAKQKGRNQVAWI